MTAVNASTSLSALERAPTLASLAYDHVKKAIVTGQLAPSSHHSEANLALTLGISRAPLREALRQLREEGLVQAAQRGVLVAPLTQKSVAEIYEVRLALEGQAAAKAAGNVPAHEILAMRTLMESIGPKIKSGDPQPFIDHDIQFHDLWVSHCQNAMLVQYIARLRDHIRRASNLASQLTDASYQAYLEHLEILDALAHGTASEFRTTVEQHISKVASRMSAAFPEDGTSAPQTDLSMLSRRQTSS